MAGLSPSVSICPGSPDHSWRTGSSRWTAPSWWWRSASTRRGWTECWGKSGCPPAPCWTAGILRPSETARGHQQSSALTHTHTPIILISALTVFRCRHFFTMRLHCSARIIHKFSPARMRVGQTVIRCTLSAH